MTPEPYITDAIRAYQDEQNRAQKKEEHARLTWQRTSEEWSTFVEGLCAKITEDVVAFNAEMTQIRGNAWLPLDAQMAGNDTLRITTPVVVRQVRFTEETHTFKIEDVGGQHSNLSRPPGYYEVARSPEGAGFDVVFNGYTTSSKVQSPAQDIVQPLIRLFLK